MCCSCLVREFRKSQYVRDEATYALEHKKLVPVAIEAVKMPFRFEEFTRQGYLTGMARKLPLIFASSSATYQRFSVIPVKLQKQAEAHEADRRRIRQEVPNLWRTYGPVAAVAVTLIIFSFVFWWPKRKITEIPDTDVVAALSAHKVFRDRLKNGQEGPEMVVIPAGTFEMGYVQGAKDELPVHTG